MSSSGATGGSIVANRWRELQGENSWSGLLDPLDMDLRKSIISYGELVQATGDGFNNEKHSPHAGDCMYEPSNLLAGTGVPAAGHYRVTKLVYATAEPSSMVPFLVLPHPALENAWSKESNFMGYVAVATDEGAAALGRRDIVVAWRGSVTTPEWIMDFEFRPVSAKEVLGSAAGHNAFAKVHRGFLSLYTASNPDSKYTKTSAKDQVLEEVRRLMEMYKDEETSITVIGHSLGAALSILNAVDIVANGLNAPAGSSRPPCPVTAIVFACPPVGDHFFKGAFQSFRDLRALHVKNKIDPVPNIINNMKILGLVYADVAVQLPINTALSPYLKDPKTTAHNLQGYLHGVAWEQGSAGGFKPEVDRDWALLNWDTDALKDEYPVPASWWVIQNKCMIKNAKGKWELKDYNL